MLASFDVATVTGWAVGGERDGAPAFGHWELPRGNDRELNRALGSLYSGVYSICRERHAAIAIIEAPLLHIKTSVATSFRLNALAGVARAAAHNADARVDLADVAQVRIYALGRGNGHLKRDIAKPLVFQWCRRMGWPVQTEDEADAVAQWAYGMSINYPKWAPRATPLFAPRAPAA